MMLVIIGIAILAILLYYRLANHYKYWTIRGVEQGTTTLIFGDNWKNITGQESFAHMMESVYKKCPGTRYSGMYSFFIPFLVVKDPELLKQMTVKDFDHFSDHMSFVPTDGDPLWEKNLFALKGQKWREMRPILSPSFTSSKMKAMFLLMAECSENFVQHFLRKDEENIVLEMKDAFTRFSNDVIATTAFGIKVDSLAEPNNEFYLKGKDALNVTGVVNMFKFLFYFIFPGLNKIVRARLFSKAVSQFFRKVIDDTIKTRGEKGIVRPDMIHLLMQARKGVQKQEENDVIDTGFAVVEETVAVNEKATTYLTNEDITAQALVFFLAGFDSVSSLMCFTAYELAVNVEVQKKLRKEVQDTFKECNGKLTYEGLLKMKYMDMVLSETLRKWPPNASLDRECTKPYTIQPVTPEEKPVHLEPGMLLLIPVFAFHRDPQYYPDPDRYDPERFSDENKEKIKPFTYFPFGLGPRNCIGSRFALLEAKTVLFNILLHFEFVPVEKTVIPLKISTKKIQISSEGDFWLGLKRIK